MTPEALANLRAAVLLRLLEAMMRQIERSGDANDAALQLLGVLFEALKELPGRNGGDDEASRRLTNLLGRLPPELRPRMERLLAAAFSGVPTRVLMESIRNPGGPDAGRLAQTLLKAADGMASVERSPASRGSDLSAARFTLPVTWGKEGTYLPPEAANGASGDGRALQAALRRLFGGGAEPHSGRVRQAGGSGAAAPPTALRNPHESPERPPVGARVNDRQGEGARPANANRSGGDGTVPAGRSLEPGRLPRMGLGSGRDAGKTAGAPQYLPPDVTPGAAAQVHGRAGHDGMLRLMAQIVAKLSEDDALILRLILQAPLPEFAASAELPLPGANEESEARRAGAGAQAGGAKGSDLPADPASKAAQGNVDAASAAAVSRQKDNAEPLPKSAAGAAAGEQPARAAAGAPIGPDRPAERLPMAFVGREAMPVPFVPYPPSQDDVITRKDAGRDEDDGAMQDDSGDEENEKQDARHGEGDEPSQQESHAGEPIGLADEHDAPDPGFAFYGNLGDDWT
ncbi:hypothetical protein [Mycoplana dimorpha]|nr:hypothetical protein [Mycoplana dimorpha]